MLRPMHWLNILTRNLPTRGGRQVVFCIFRIAYGNSFVNDLLIYNLNRIQKVAYAPRPLGNPRTHRSSRRKCALIADKVVIGKVQCYRCLQILNLLGKGISQASKPPNIHAHCEVLSRYGSHRERQVPGRRRGLCVLFQLTLVST